jgi:hypothetical protein
LKALALSAQVNNQLSDYEQRQQALEVNAELSRQRNSIYAINSLIQQGQYDLNVAKFNNELLNQPTTVVLTQPDGTIETVEAPRGQAIPLQASEDLLSGRFDYNVVGPDGEVVGPASQVLEEAWQQALAADPTLQELNARATLSGEGPVIEVQKKRELANQMFLTDPRFRRAYELLLAEKEKYNRGYAFRGLGPYSGSPFTDGR